MGTAVTVQAMVFGNMGEDCATGVAFTRNSTGERAHYGEFLINAQGEDVVAGIRTPQPLTRSMAQGSGAEGLPMEDALPEAYAELSGVFDRSSGTTARCRTSSSRSSAASSTSRRLAAASAPPRPRSRSRSTWRARG